MKTKVLKAISYVAAIVGLLASGASSMGCLFFWFDEPEMSKSMLK